MENIDRTTDKDTMYNRGETKAAYRKMGTRFSKMALVLRSSQQDSIQSRDTGMESTQSSKKHKDIFSLFTRMSSSKTPTKYSPNLRHHTDQDGMKISPPIKYESGYHRKTDAVDSFAAYVERLPEWEKPLISKIEMLIDEEDIYDIFQDDIILFLVSDGGVENGFRYFQWVIGTCLDTIVQHKGYAAGNPSLIESLHIESKGALSVLSCVFHFCQYHSIKVNRAMWTYFCNNKATVRRIQ
jgi:hypothetical protein